MYTSVYGLLSAEYLFKVYEDFICYLYSKDVTACVYPKQASGSTSPVTTTSFALQVQFFFPSAIVIFLSTRDELLVRHASD